MKERSLATICRPVPLGAVVPCSVAQDKSDATLMYVNVARTGMPFLVPSRLSGIRGKGDPVSIADACLELRREDERRRINHQHRDPTHTVADGDHLAQAQGLDHEGDVIDVDADRIRAHGLVALAMTAQVEGARGGVAGTADARRCAPGTP